MNAERVAALDALEKDARRSPRWTSSARSSCRACVSSRTRKAAGATSFACSGGPTPSRRKPCARSSARCMRRRWSATSARSSARCRCLPTSSSGACISCSAPRLPRRHRHGAAHRRLQAGRSLRRAPARRAAHRVPCRRPARAARILDQESRLGDLHGLVHRRCPRSHSRLRLLRPADLLVDRGRGPSRLVPQRNRRIRAGGEHRARHGFHRSRGGAQHPGR